jgi:hypothetical protein
VIVALIGTLGGIIIAKINHSKHIVNSRMDELLKVSKELAQRIGKEEGIAEEKDAQKKREDNKK